MCIYIGAKNLSKEGMEAEQEGGGGGGERRGGRGWVRWFYPLMSWTRSFSVEDPVKGSDHFLTLAEIYGSLNLVRVLPVGCFSIWLFLNAGLGSTPVERQNAISNQFKCKLKTSVAYKLFDSASKYIACQDQTQDEGDAVNVRTGRTSEGGSKGSFLRTSSIARILYQIHNVLLIYV